MNIPIAERVRQYELTYLLPVSLTAAETKAAHSQVEDLVKKHKGSVKNKEEWGKKQLAYSIKHDGKKQTEALYTHLILEFTTTVVPSFERDLQLFEKNMRHLLVIADNKNGGE